ncbi:hypothetical protein [Streptomyces sp. LN245]|uniref:hypothetical protein n=1 Tax=Streptomyces sp. LN245 TaxID=3112975 RepID=UPI003723B9CD
MATVPVSSSPGLKPVVVGVSRSEASRDGVAWAAEEAEAALLVVGAKPLNVVEQLFVFSPLGVTLTAHAGRPVAVARRPQLTAGTVRTELTAGTVRTG